MIATRLRLPVGARWVPPTGRGYHVVLQDHRGNYHGPIYILREVTKEDYCDWAEANTGRPLKGFERTERLRNLRFYEISLD